VLKIRRKNALAEHIIMSFKTKAAQAQLVAFYNNQWLNIPFQSIDTAFVFPLTFEIADELERVGGEILGGVNRSKAFRVMVAYFAFVHKLKNQWTEMPCCAATFVTIRFHSTLPSHAMRDPYFWMAISNPKRTAAYPG
jgi:hypothetical protein